MKAIWKYALEAEGGFTISMPNGAQILCIQTQGGNPRMWALVDPVANEVTRHFAMFGTGQPMPNNPGKYVGTFQVYGGDLVFHVFEITKTD